MRILGIHLGHNSHFCFIEDGIVKSVFETERYYRLKAHKVHAISLEPKNYISTYQYVHIDELRESLKYFLSLWGYNYDYIAVENQGRESEFENLKIILEQLSVKYKNIESLNHHFSHACSAFFTSKFKKALIFSYDGQGNDGRTVFFHGEGNKVSYLEKIDIPLGSVYNNIGFILNIRPEVTGETSGKSMGLSGYGEIQNEWIPNIRKHIINYKRRKSKVVEGLQNYGKDHVINSIYLDKIKELKPYKIKNSLWIEISVKFTKILKLKKLNRIFQTRLGYIKLDGPENKISQDLMTTFQYCWTIIVKELIDKYADKYENLCVVGGCALNGITNYELLQKWGWENVHFIPNPSDCGTAIGAALKVYWEKSGKEFVGYPSYYNPYIGMDIFDANNLIEYEKKYPNLKIPKEKYIKILAKLLYKGKIIGVINEKSEIGPRALGNRSIFCNPLIKDMKETLNNKVKHREWFRPFAPVCTYEDSKKYFTNKGEISYMSVVCDTKPEYREILPSTTHVDGSARLQTITYEQNSFLYELLKEFEINSGYPILLNTSLNPKGEPILNFLKVGLEMVENTDMDYLAYNNIIFGKKKI